MRNLLILLVFLIACPGFAKNYALIIGGSGEDHKKENFFLSDFDRLNKSLKDRGFEVVNVFDNAKTEGKFSAAVADNKNIQNAIDNIMKTAKEGDQVAIIFHAHGQQPGFGSVDRSHSVFTESGHFSIDKLLPHLEKTKSRVLLADLSCYSGHTQYLVDLKASSVIKISSLPDRRPIHPAKAAEKLCIITAASPHYVSICSGSRDSNSFTSALLEDLERREKVSAEELFLRARPRDFSFTNLPHISSFTAMLENQWNSWLHRTDPSGLKEPSFVSEGKVCEECIDKYRQEIEASVHDLAQILTSDARKLLKDYEQAVKDQASLNSALALKSEKARLTLTKTEKYKKFAIWDDQDIAGLLQVIAMSPQQQSVVLDQAADELKQQISDIIKNQSLFLSFAKDLHREVSPLRDAVRSNRNRIAATASKVLQHERDQYTKAFQSKKGNVCQNFQL